VRYRNKDVSIISNPGLLILLILPVWIFPVNGASGAFEERFIPPRALAMGGVYSVLSTGESALFGNVANLSFVERVRVDVQYARPFGLKELAQSGLTVAIPNRRVSFGFGISRFGFSAYEEKLITAGFSKKILEQISAGIALRYMSVAITGYGAASVIGLDAGILIKMTESLNFALVAKNINSPKVMSKEEPVSPNIKIGFSYSPHSSVVLVGEWQKERDFDKTIRLGAELELIKGQYLRFGLSNNPSSFSMGFGLSMNGTDINFSAVTHQYLDLSQSLSFGYLF